MAPKTHTARTPPGHPPPARRARRQTLPNDPEFANRSQSLAICERLRYTGPVSRAPIQLIKDPAVWSTIIAPVRHEIVETLRYLAPCSIAELAATLSRPPSALYRHVRLLQGVGVVVHAGYRRAGRQTEELFDLAADDVRIAFAGAPGGRPGRPRPDEQAALDETVAVFLRSLHRTYADSSRAGALVVSPEDRNFSFFYDLTWLTPEAFAKARAHLTEYLRLLDEGRKRREGRQYASLLALLPAVRPPPRHRARDDSAAARTSSTARPSRAPRRAKPAQNPRRPASRKLSPRATT